MHSGKSSNIRKHHHRDANRSNGRSDVSAWHFLCSSILTESPYSSDSTIAIPSHMEVIIIAAPKAVRRNLVDRVTI
jgi:hypothetical protein